jgi:hypothetical protein
MKKEVFGMDVHEYIIASTIMEYDRERRKAKQEAQQRAQEARIRQREQMDKEMNKLLKECGLDTF